MIWSAVIPFAMARWIEPRVNLAVIRLGNLEPSLQKSSRMAIARGEDV